MKHVAQRTVVQNHNLAKVWFNRAQIFDEGAVPECTMLTVISTRKEFALLLQPVNDRIGVFLDRSSENNEVIPFADLYTIRASHCDDQSTNPSQEIIAVGSLVDVIKNWMLRAE